jgi:hypothetical protein
MEGASSMLEAMTEQDYRNKMLKWKKSPVVIEGMELIDVMVEDMEREKAMQKKNTRREGRVSVLRKRLRALVLIVTQTPVREKMDYLPMLLPSKVMLELDGQELELQAQANDLAAENAAASGDSYRADQHRILADKNRQRKQEFHAMHLQEFAYRYGQEAAYGRVEQ